MGDVEQRQAHSLRPDLLIAGHRRAAVEADDHRTFALLFDAALACLREARFKKGDIIFITDGECQVDAEWAEKFRDEKKRLGFSLFSILIDMGPASLGTLKEFSDRISTIKQLTGEEAKEIFVKF